jgi:hypothetical protein
LAAGLAVAWALGASTAQAAANAPGPEQAVTLARITLARQLDTDIGKIQLVSVEPRTWPNSGLGCAASKQTTLQVLTEGYVVTLAAPGGERRIHVAGDRALVCDRPGFTLRPRVGLSAHVIAALSQLAREDLARRLAIPVDEIRVAKLTPVQWRNSALECPAAGEVFEEHPVRGYVLLLRHRDREFTYHTDSERVRPCPAIESE